MIVFTLPRREITDTNDFHNDRFMIVTVLFFLSFLSFKPYNNILSLEQKSFLSRLFNPFFRSSFLSSFPKALGDDHSLSKKFFTDLHGCITYSQDTSNKRRDKRLSLFRFHSFSQVSLTYSVSFLFLLSSIAYNMFSLPCPEVSIKDGSTVVNFRAYF